MLAMARPRASVPSAIPVAPITPVDVRPRSKSRTKVRVNSGDQPKKTNKVESAQKSAENSPRPEPVDRLAESSDSLDSFKTASQSSATVRMLE